MSQALAGAVFPLGRRELVRVARENEAAPSVLSLLEGLPEGLFLTLDEVRAHA